MIPRGIEMKYPLGRFSVPPCDHVWTRAGSVEARRAGCETVSVTDSLRPPDRLAQRASFQNDLSVVHTEKKSDESPERRRLCPFRRGAVYRRFNDVPSKTPSMPETRLAFTSACLIDSARVVLCALYRLHKHRYLMYRLCVNRMLRSLFLSSHVPMKIIFLSDCRYYVDGTV